MVKVWQYLKNNMINLFNINNYAINTSDYSNALHDKRVTEFENRIANYVGAKYAVALNSATNAIFLTLLNKRINVSIPSVIPPVVPNAIYTSGNEFVFTDNVNWVGDSYILHDFKDYKIVDSAQKIEPNQFALECQDKDIMIFSFYPTKPIGSFDGGMIVSNDLDKITYFREMSLNGMTFSQNNWDRKNKYLGYKMYMNSIQADVALKNFSKYEDKRIILKSIRTYYNDHLKQNNTSYHLYRIATDDNNKFIGYMKTKNIICGIHYKALHLDPVYKKSDHQTLPMSEFVSKTTVSIPFHEQLSLGEVQYIIKCIQEYKNVN